MRLYDLFEAVKTIDLRRDEMWEMPYFPEKEKPEFIPKSSGFYFTFNNGVLLLNSTANAFYEIKAAGGSKEDNQIISKLWNQFGGKVDLQSKTITIAKESTRNGTRVPTSSRDTLYRQAFANLRKYGVTDDFKIKGWGKGTTTLGKYLEGSDSSIAIKSNKGEVTMYHGTSSAAWEEIKTKGLRPGKADGVYADLVPGYSEHNVYLTTSSKTAEFYGKRQAKKDGSPNYVILSVKVPDLAKLSADDSLVNRNDDLDAIRKNHTLMKMSVDEDGSVAYRGIILPTHISLVSTRKA